MIRSIQLLRAIAAILVVFFHSQGKILDSNGFTNVGASGVDIFFVISGFIMVLTSYNQFGQKNASLKFLQKRAERIVPTYYLFTTLTVGILIFLPNLYNTLEFDLEFVILSYLFILSNNYGEIGTLVVVGWTLAFEAFFYLLFAIMLNFKRNHLLPILSIIFTAGTVIGLIFDGGYAWTTVITNPLVFEFLFGCIIGFVYQQEKPFSKKLSVSLVIIGITWIYTAATFGFNSSVRVLAFGIPATLIVAGFIFFEKQVKLNIPKIFLKIGDSSYSLYLVHVYTLQVCLVTIVPSLVKMNVPNQFVIILLVLISIFTGFICYYSFERPVMYLIKRLSKNRIKQKSVFNAGC